MAFTDNDNIYLRGSGTGVTSFGSWAKMWTSLNDGPGSGMDADRFDNKQGEWYQNALNINYGTLSDNRLPTFISATKVRDVLTVQSFNGDSKYRIYISGSILNTSPFVPGGTVNLYDANAQATGTIAIDNLVINDDTADNFNDYTIIIGRLTSGNFVGALQIGTASNRVSFDDFAIDDDNVVEVAKLESDGGTANLRLGRTDGVATSPAIYFTSANNAPTNYNVAMIATGGTATDGSGTLNVLVADANGLNVNGSVVWNSGNIEFQSANVVNTGVKRDANGDFAAGTITANLTGSASENVLKAGDTMTGSLTITGGASSTFSVSGTASLLSTVNITDDLAVDTDTLFVDVSTDRVGINAGVNPIATLDIKGDDGIYVRTNTSGGASGTEGARIRFTTRPSDTSQNGTLRYNHLDAQSPGSDYGEGFTFLGTEPELYLRVVGDILASRKMGVNINREPDYTLEVDGNARLSSELRISNTSSGAINFYNNSSTRYWRVGSNTAVTNFFTFEASDAAGNTTFSGAPVIGLSGDNNAVTINTTDTSGTDPSDGTTVRNYKLNVSGDVNFNGQLFQNNSEFVTSRWTEAPNGNDIYRASRVGIGFSSNRDPAYGLDVEGTVNLTEELYANGDKQWLDTYGIFKANRNTLDEDVTVPANTNCMSAGPVTINNTRTVTIANGASWSVV